VSALKAAAFLKLKLFTLLGRARPAARLGRLDSADALLATLRSLAVKPFTLPDGARREGVVLFDFDDTLAPRNAVVLPAASLALVQRVLAAGYAAAVLSNKRANETYAPRYRELEALGVHVARNVAPKPSGAAFAQTLTQVSARLGVTLSPFNAAMVGDKQGTDGGSTLVGIPFIQVAHFGS
jgi:predicted HAD superfamily phosphohydrolase YqeG